MSFSHVSSDDGFLNANKFPYRSRSKRDHVAANNQIKGKRSQKQRGSNRVDCQFLGGASESLRFRFYRVQHTRSRFVTKFKNTSRKLVSFRRRTECVPSSRKWWKISQTLSIHKRTKEKLSIALPARRNVLLLLLLFSFRLLHNRVRILIAVLQAR